MTDRIELIKQVMNEKSLSLIEASKYIKANNLYTPKPKEKTKKEAKKEEAKEEAKEEPIKKQVKKQHNK